MILDEVGDLHASYEAKRALASSVAIRRGGLKFDQGSGRIPVSVTATSRRTAALEVMLAAAVSAWRQ